MSPAPHLFGLHPDGRAVEAWTLEGAGGLEVEVLSYGGIVRRLLVPDRRGQRADVVLGYDRLEAYLERHPYFGAIVGRVAGRMTGARFILNGEEFRLTATEGRHHIHGGVTGLDRRIWEVEPAGCADGTASLSLTYRSPDGEEGYPGNVDFRLTYTVTPDNAFIIESEAATDRATPLNVTHHSYFNLGGGGDVRDHRVIVWADTYFPLAEDFALLDREELVAGTGEDLNMPTLLSEAIPRLFGNHGSLYRVRRAIPDEAIVAARVEHWESGRTLEVSTTESHLQFYTGSMLDGAGPSGKGGVAHPRHAGLCLECQGYPNGTTFPDLGDIVLRPGEIRRHRTEYRFACE